ncbi:uncharacterized WD repeat-containing protein [[Candida] jaroonii]|uniref:Uncharacterized WD repeat-containing protein n=1 Tax=[Candida] jaroonii TaxID=467808 RepID=A0ACA9Y761_9ASCO|nr:uncharacterized WD repeat-containing protein [[Candida] jaroonii]
MNAHLDYRWNGDVDEWVLAVELWNQGFVCSTSNGVVRTYDFTGGPMNQFTAHEGSINAIKFIDSNLLSTCSTDGIKIWDLRTQQQVHGLTNDNNTFLSLDYRQNILAGGTELMGTDAELHLWDIRNPQAPMKSYVDSHHDDITAIKFHPTQSQYLMSGSTDGYVNIYDLNETDEDDSLHQVINYNSVHSCNFISPQRIAILSHMETLSFHSLNNTNYETIEEKEMNDLGDVRSNWTDCEYVIDLNPQGFVSFGANSANSLSLVPFNGKSETFDLSKRINFPGAHGEEVVRDMKVWDGKALTCGEDGVVKLWKLPYVVELNEVSEEKEKKEKKHKDKKDKKHKDKKDKKDRKDKKHKDKKDKKDDVRFKPY